MSRTPTPEQQACIDALVSGVPKLQIRACAGSGKTSTLQMCAVAKEVPSLYLAFNKKTADEGTEKFPKHVTCRTTHSMAYAAFGAKLRNKLSRPYGKYVNVAGTGSEIARYFSINSFENGVGISIPSGLIGICVRETVARFEQSADEKIGKHHVYLGEIRDKLSGESDAANVSYLKDQIFKYAQRLWKERIDVNSVALATHDTYLKLYQLSKPNLSQYDVLYVDEFQDTTPCVMDIVMQQEGRCQLVMVGDARQAIYEWRGAVNAMELVQCETKLLSKSWRYGNAVADLATLVLERDMVITGNENINSVVGLEDVVDRSKPYTRLFRTNSALLSAAIGEISKGTEVAIEIDVRDFVKLLQSAEALYRGNLKDVKHDKLLPYSVWYEAVAEGKNDAELGRVTKIVADGLSAQWIPILENFKNSTKPHVTFTTAHKSKGREFDQVIVESDFKSCYNDKGEWIGLAVAEQNLLYVALTRAILALEYNETTAQYVNRYRKTNKKVEEEFHHEVTDVIKELERDMQPWLD